MKHRHLVKYAIVDSAYRGIPENPMPEHLFDIEKLAAEIDDSTNVSSILRFQNSQVLQFVFYRLLYFFIDR
jgi:hypothetical protein